METTLIVLYQTEAILSSRATNVSTLVLSVQKYTPRIKKKKLIWHPLLPDGFVYLSLIKYLIPTFKICHLRCGSLFLPEFKSDLYFSDWMGVTVLTAGKTKNKTQQNLCSRNEMYMVNGNGMEIISYLALLQMQPILTK